ncbi:MAG: EFR1 family ferrodoxin [Candidatus Helarchaeota archaeon]
MLTLSIKSVILYFSQVVTGNTKRIAEKIAEGIRSTGSTCELVHLKKFKDDLGIIKKMDFHQYDLIGLGVPVYYFHPPYHILFELKEYPSLNGLKGFLFCTSGGNPGSTLHQMKVILKNKGLQVIDGRDDWIGWDVHQMYGHMGGWLPSSRGHPDEQELNEAHEFGRTMVQKCLNQSTPEKQFWEKDNPSAKMWTFEYMQEWFPEFHLEEEKCTKCGYCAEICPVDSIVLDPFPTWTKDCDRCYICELKCPTKAIWCDWTKQRKYLDDLMSKARKKKT